MIHSLGSVPSCFSFPVSERLREREKSVCVCGFPRVYFLEQHLFFHAAFYSCTRTYFSANTSVLLCNFAVIYLCSFCFPASRSFAFLFECSSYYVHTTRTQELKLLFWRRSIYDQSLANIFRHYLLAHRSSSIILGTSTRPFQFFSAFVFLFGSLSNLHFYGFPFIIRNL